MITLQEIQKKIEKFGLKTQINEAVSIQDKIQFFSSNFTASEYAPCYQDEYLRKMKRKISNQKAYSRFREGIQYPLPTVSFCDTVYNSISKIFSGDGKFIEYFPDTKYEGIGFSFAKDTLWDRFIFAPNSLIVTWKSEKQNYRFFIDISCVQYIDFSGNDIFEIAYKDKDCTIYINDTEFVKIKDDKIEEQYNHKFGFCPVDFLSNEQLDYKRPLLRVNPIVSVLGEIEELLTVSVMSNVINRFMLPYVVEAKKTGAEAGCHYTYGNQYCENGYLYSQNTEGVAVSILDNGLPAKCPQCNKEIGFGSVLEIPATGLSADEFEKAANNSLLFKSLGIDSLEYPARRKKELETDIYNKVVNKQEFLNNSQQHNELRVMSTYEEKTTVLIKWKQVFENILARLITKDIQLFKKGYRTTVVSFGNKFYLNSSEQYQELIQKSKENGINDYMDYEYGLIEVQYSENVMERNRIMFLLELEKVARPYRNLKNTEVIDLLKSGIITKQEFDLNTNFYKKVREIEIEEHKPITDVYIDKPIDEQIKLLTIKLQENGQTQVS